MHQKHKYTYKQRKRKEILTEKVGAPKTVRETNKEIEGNTHRERERE
jgi:hypothetical protein